MILLTGATGYLGSQIARELARRGEPFRVLVRRPNLLGFDPAAARCEVVAGDLTDPGALAKAAAGAKYVIHTAALVKRWVRDPGEFRRVNVEAFKLLCQTASSAERIVYTSSFLALGPSADPATAEGRRRPGPFLTDYERSKAEALEWLRGAGFRQFPVVALLPAVIYGPGPATEGNLVGEIVRRYLHSALPAMVGKGDRRWSFAFNRDVVDAHLAALRLGGAGEEYILGGDNRSLNDLFGVLAEISGRKRRVLHLPFGLARGIAHVDVLRARLFGSSPDLTPGIVEVFRHDWVYSSAKAREHLGYRATRLEDGLAATFQGLKNAIANHQAHD